MLAKHCCAILCWATLPYSQVERCLRFDVDFLDEYSPKLKLIRLVSRVSATLTHVMCIYQARPQSEI